MIKVFCHCLLVLFVGVASVSAQKSVVGPGTDSVITGTIKEYTSGKVLILQTLPPNPPMQFKLSKSTMYADTDGKPVEAPGLRTNQKVRVHYRAVGGDNVADKVTMVGN
jgi:hypothetical protein